MSDSRTTDVLIVGAGPTGLSLACQCIRHGVDFVIIDRNTGVTPYSKAIGVHARTLEIYEQMELAERAVDEGWIASKGRLIVGGEVRGEIELSRIGAGFSRYPFVLMLEQSKNEQLLHEYMQSHGHEVSWTTSFESLTQRADGVTASVRGADGEAGRIDAKYLVGCDGAKSPVRHALGLVFEGSTFERTFYVADCRVDWTFSHDALHICLLRDSFVLLFPLKGERRYRIVGVFPEEFTGEPESVVYEQIERNIKEGTGIPLDIHDVEWFSTYKVHTRHVSAFSSGRCFLAGDAAHIHSPAGAQGMNTGIQDAYNLAWKLALTLHGKVPPSLLDSYDAERLPNAKRLLETTDRMFQLAAGSNPLVSFLRMNVVPQVANRLLRMGPVQSFLFPTLSQIGINYRGGPLSDHEGDGEFDVKAGDRMPWFEIDGTSIYDRLRAPCFHWVVFTDAAPQHERAPAGGDLFDRRVLPLHTNIAEAFGITGPFSVLLRPDNHIAFLSTSTEVARVRRYVEEVLGRSQ
jgi:2-polyprenyl-6-methoxyphenol hydroxylase-like FAD-dependent oxidoreductase